MKRAPIYGLISFVLIYATCLLFGPASQNLVTTVFQYLFWSLPSSLIIGLVLYFQRGRE